MRLDTDLGIDSIKRVEILSAVQDRLPDSRPTAPTNSGLWARFVRLSTFLGSAGHGTATAGHTSPAGSLARRRLIGWHRSAAAVRNLRRRHGDIAPTTNNGQPALARSVLRVLHPAVRIVSRQAMLASEFGFRAGGTVWVTSDGSPLTEAVCAALSKRDYRVRDYRARG